MDSDTSDNDSPNEEVASAISYPRRSIEVRWLDADIVQETFAKVLKPRWSKLTPKGNTFISWKSSIVFTRYRSYCGHSKLP